MTKARLAAQATPGTFFWASRGAAENGRTHSGSVLARGEIVRAEEVSAAVIGDLSFPAATSLAERTLVIGQPSLHKGRGDLKIFEVGTDASLRLKVLNLTSEWREASFLLGAYVAANDVGLVAASRVISVGSANVTEICLLSCEQNSTGCTLSGSWRSADPVCGLKASRDFLSVLVCLPESQTSTSNFTVARLVSLRDLQVKSVFYSGEKRLSSLFHGLSDRVWMLVQNEETEVASIYGVELRSGTVVRSMAEGKINPGYTVVSFSVASDFKSSLLATGMPSWLHLALVYVDDVLVVALKTQPPYDPVDFYPIATTTLSSGIEVVLEQQRASIILSVYENNANTHDVSVAFCMQLLGAGARLLPNSLHISSKGIFLATQIGEARPMLWKIPFKGTALEPLVQPSPFQLLTPDSWRTAWAFSPGLDRPLSSAFPSTPPASTSTSTTSAPPWTEPTAPWMDNVTTSTGGTTGAPQTLSNPLAQSTSQAGATTKTGDCRQAHPVRRQSSRLRQWVGGKRRRTVPPVHSPRTPRLLSLWSRAF
jgi:hypothetical protein